MYRFEKLRVYHDAMVLVELVYQIIKKLPNEEKFGLSDQLRRSVISIVLNIAEGTGSLGDIEFKNFLRHSLKSLYETVAGLKIAEKLFGANTNAALDQCDKVGRELNALIKSLNNDRKLKTKD